jgi:competence protein CoiA
MIKSGEDRSGRQIWIAEAANGSACDLVCPHCREPLIAKQGKIVDWHFAHSSGTECARAVETALHKMAKQIFAETRALTLPRIEYLYGRRFIVRGGEKLCH